MKNDRPQINVRADLGEIEAWRQAADREGLSLSEWLRRVASKAAKRSAGK